MCVGGTAEPFPNPSLISQTKQTSSPPPSRNKRGYREISCTRWRVKVIVLTGSNEARSKYIYIYIYIAVAVAYAASTAQDNMSLSTHNKTEAETDDCSEFSRRRDRSLWRCRGGPVLLVVRLRAAARRKRERNAEWQPGVYISCAPPPLFANARLATSTDAPCLVEVGVRTTATAN